VQQLTGCQTRLRVYIAMLTGNPTAASDVLQETNLVLCRKADEYVEGTDFVAWACTFARFQVMAYLRNVKRDRHMFDEAIVNNLASDAEDAAGQIDAQHSALQKCLKKLTGRQRKLVIARYTDAQSIEEIATRNGDSNASVAMALSRIRQLLFRCIQRRLAGEQSS